MTENRSTRFFRTTRGRIVTMLRRKSCTVNDLSAELGITDNAVRAQLATLERDGLVAEHGTSRGTRKPHITYTLTAQADQLFPKAYEPILSELLAVMSRKLTSRRMDGLMRAVGKRLAAAFKTHASGSNLHARVQAAVDVLGQLGGLAEIEEKDKGKLIIRGCSCPLKSIVKTYPGACQLAETLLGEIIGVPVRERCDKGPTPRCCFEVSANN